MSNKIIQKRYMLSRQDIENGIYNVSDEFDYITKLKSKKHKRRNNLPLGVRMAEALAKQG